MSLLLTFGKKSVIQRAISVLRKFGTNAHAYIPGVGVLNGMTAGNYTDTAGTQLTTKDQFVGLDLDAMGSLGAELVTNGGFDANITGWGDIAAWTGGSAVWSSGGIEVTVVTYQGAAQNISGLTIGASYRLNFNVAAVGSGKTGRMYVGAINNPGSTTVVNSSSLGVGSYSMIFVATATTHSIGLSSSSGDGVITWDNISVKEVTGIRATQGTAGNKPVLRHGPVNMLLNSATLSTQSVAVAASPYTLSFTGTGTLTKSGTATGALVGTGATDRVTQTFTPTAGTLTLTVTGSVTSAQLQLGSAATTYIPTTSAKASAGTGPSYWEFGGDGTPTDYLSLGSVPFQMSDDFVVVASVNILPSGPWKTIFSVVGAGAIPRAQIFVSSTGLASVFFRDDAGVSIERGAVDVRTTTTVISVKKVGTGISLRVNGAQVASFSVSGLGATTFTVAAIGCLSIGADYALGNIYSEFVIKGTVSDADRLLIEKLAANLAGVTLA